MPIVGLNSGTFCLPAEHTNEMPETQSNKTIYSIHYNNKVTYAQYILFHQPTHYIIVCMGLAPACPNNVSLKGMHTVEGTPKLTNNMHSSGLL